MQKLKFPLLFSTIYVLFFSLTPHSTILLKVFFLLFAFSPLVMIWLVVRVLKDGVAPKQKFSDGHWYSDIQKPTGSPCPEGE
jgi:hypothetical protein